MSLTHLDEQGRARMVDVGHKGETDRSAVARGRVHMLPATRELLASGQAKKGDVLAAARIAAIMAAKRTSELIPLCHVVRLTAVEVAFELEERGVAIEVTARALDRTGVEMEALTAVSIAALTIYDMLKAVDRAMTIEGIALEEKRGGASGDFAR